MVTSNNSAEELLSRKFKKVKKGLDEAEVFSTMEELLERNRNLTDRFAHLDSLTKLAERTVIRAEEIAETIKKEAERAATSQAASIIVSAKEQAKSEADRLIAETRQRANEDAHRIVTSARCQAEEIVRAAETQAQQQTAEIMRGAEAEAQLHAEQIVKAAQVRTQQQAQELRSQSKEILVSTIVEKFRRFVDNLISGIDEIETPHPD
jgi:colicin import membrane protein